MKSKKVLICQDSNGKRVRVAFDNLKLISGLLNAIDNDNLQRKDLAVVVGQILRSLSSSSKKVEFKNEKLEDKKLEKRVPFPQDIVLRTSSLEKGLNDIYNDKSLNYSQHLNPFTPALSKIRLDKYENAKLSKFLDEVMIVKNVVELDRIVDTALESGVDRVNARGESGWSFANFVMFKMHLDKFDEDEQRNIMCKLILKGATLDDDLLRHNKRTNKIYDELHEELQPQLQKQLTELRKVAENASTQGTVKDVEFDNKNFYMEFSKDSIVDVRKVIDGTKKLGFDKGDVKIGNDVIKIGDNELEFRVEEDGKINYLDVSDNGSIKLTLRIGSRVLGVYLFHSSQDYNKIQVRVDNAQLWKEFKNEAIVRNCLLGEITLEEAVRNGNFTRCGRLGSEISPEVKEKTKEKTKEICKDLLSDNSEKSKTPWVEKVSKDNKTKCFIL